MRQDAARCHRTVYLWRRTLQDNYYSVFKWKNVAQHDDKQVGELVCALRGFPWTGIICVKWHHRPRDHKYRNICCPEIWSFEIFQDGGRPNLAFGTTGSRSIRSAVPKNPTLGSNTKSIGRSFAEIWPFETLTLMTSLMTSQGQDQKSVKKNYFPQVGDHCVKISAQSDKNWRRRSIFKKMLDDVINDVTRPDQKSVKKNFFP